MQQPFSEKQLNFILRSTKKWNFAHGAVRTGKTVCTTFRFMQAVEECPDDKIRIVGHTTDTVFRNVISLIMDSPQLSLFRPFCTWSNRKLYYKDKCIPVLGAKDEGAISNFQGDTYSLVLCDEITLYPPSIIYMIDTRLSQPHSIGIATMNPSYPSHIVKQWIDKGQAGDPNYYDMHFTLEDNPYVDENYKNRVKNSLTGLFYKRNYLGLWCLAEGAIFDFFDRDIHVVKKPPCAAEYWIAAVDYGFSNPCCCLLLGISTGRYTQTAPKIWVEKEYYWDQKVQFRQKMSGELAEDIRQFLEPYSVNSVYVDPSAAEFKLQLQKKGLHVVPANNEVLDGIEKMTSEMHRGNLVVCAECVNLIREIECYIWDSRAAEQGEDRPKKKADHAVDALRYALATHKIAKYEPYKHNANKYMNDRFTSHFG